MIAWISRLRATAPDRFLVALLVASAFALFVSIDLSHWWYVRDEYAFGWFAPMLAVFVVASRWKRIAPCLDAGEPSPLPRWLQRLSAGVAGMLLVCGLLVFLLGALYRAGAGASQPGSLALATGFGAMLLALVYLNVEPSGVTSERGTVDARFFVMAQFLFPALVWILSAPLVTAVETEVSLFLLRRVITVVSWIFGILGYPLVQEGNVLVLPHGQVGVAEACSGIRSLTGCLFAGAFLAAEFLSRFWQKALLVAASLGLAFFTNLLRSLFLTAWAYAFGSEAIEGRLHDMTGWMVLGLTSLLLFWLVPLLKPENWRRWLGRLGF